MLSGVTRRKLPSRCLWGKVTFLPMSDLTCARCEREGGRVKAPPVPGDLGRRIFDSICQQCWQDWLKEQTAIINHYGLNVLDPKARTFLLERTENFLFGAQNADT